MAFSLGSISAQIGIDTSGYSRGILTANALTTTFGQTFTTFVTNPVLGGINALTQLGRSAFRAAGDILGEAEAMQRLGDQTGIAASAIQALRLQTELAVGSAERADQFVRQFSTRFGQAQRGAAEMQRTLADLGVTLDQDANTAFRNAIRELAGMEDASRRNALAAQLFGEEAGPQIIQVLREFGGEIDLVVQKYQDIGRVTDDFSNNQLAGLNTNLAFTAQAFEGLRNTAVREFILGLAGDAGDAQLNIQELARTMNEDIAPAARAVGEAVAAAAEALGDLGDSDLVLGVKELADILGPLGTVIGELNKLRNAGVDLALDVVTGNFATRRELAQPLDQRQLGRAGQ